MTPERLSALRDALQPALASLGFVPGLLDGPAPSVPPPPEGLLAWSSEWATVLVVPTDAARLEATSTEVELWAREAFGLPRRNRPRRDWYLLLAVDAPVAARARLGVENTDRVVRRHVVEWKDGAWDLGRVALLPLGSGGEPEAVAGPEPLPGEAQAMLDLYRGSGQAVKATREAIDAAARGEADDAR